MVEQEWQIPPDDRPSGQIRCTRNELLLLDYVLSSGSGLLLQHGLDDLVPPWRGFRQSVWDAIIQIEAHPEDLGILLDIGDTEADILLATAPTTMTWGDGVDCGFALKLKLAQFRAGVYEDDVVVARRRAEQQERDSEATREAQEVKMQQEARESAVAAAMAKVSAAKSTLAQKRKEARTAKENSAAAQLLLDQLERDHYGDNSTSEDQTDNQAHGEAGPTADEGAWLLAGEDLSDADR
ncbi:hypothetical protein CMI37_14395 [Candidatus Pacearchaeota archaeon]|nr:hypothetical protein [Candidatus Pacearchaeota archaeon]